MIVRAAILAAAVLATTAAPAAATVDRCEWVLGVLAAAEETEPFASLRGAAVSSGESRSIVTVPGFAVRHCTILDLVADFGEGAALWCRRSLAGPELTARGLADLVADCAGEPVASDPWPGLERYHIDVGGVRIFIKESGTDRAHVGRSIELIVRRLEAQT